MSKFFLDAGTTWSKILEIKENGERVYTILPSGGFFGEYEFEKTTGHRAGGLNTKEHVNEVVALSYGVKSCFAHLKESSGIVIDLGSRDAKWVKYREGKFSDMDWNSSCASATGATVEMLLKFYNVKAADLSYEKEKYPVTCGIFALENIMDDVSKGISAKTAISKFIHGLAFGAWNFTKNPQKLFVSGGFCENKCFVDSLSNYCEVVPLGRFTPLNGLSQL